MDGYIGEYISGVVHEAGVVLVGGVVDYAFRCVRQEEVGRQRGVAGDDEVVRVVPDAVAPAAEAVVLLHDGHEFYRISNVI